MVMRTPGDEIAHAAGFCLAEGIVDTPDDFNELGLCDGSDSNVITITLSSDRRHQITSVLERRAFISQTSCGVCGKEIVDDLNQMIRPLSSENTLNIQDAYYCLENLSKYQPVRQKTRSSHAALLFNTDFEMLAAGEDVGRHNALDKVIGKLFLKKRLPEAVLLVLSSRISYELVQKAARARIQIIFAISRPTSLAVELAERLNITLACLAKGNGLDIFCGIHRLVIPAK
jgi:FdhD protein